MGWRLKLGVAIFVLSILLPVAGIPLVATLDLSGTVTASVSRALLVGAEVLGVLAVLAVISGTRSGHCSCTATRFVPRPSSKQNKPARLHCVDVRWHCNSDLPENTGKVAF